ncbi:MAG: hypothetical protein M3445_05930, partial [Actinomycetota bacterium]|nr:hypothetical protein [Actinomycetota bacterium]
LQDVASKPRWYRVNTGMAVGRVVLWCAEDGFDLDVPDDAEADAKAVATRVRASHRTNGDGRVLVEQRAVDGGRPVDSEDRVQLCIRLVRDLATSVEPIKPLK